MYKVTVSGTEKQAVQDWDSPGKKNMQGDVKRALDFCLQATSLFCLREVDSL